MHSATMLHGIRSPARNGMTTSSPTGIDAGTVQGEFVSVICPTLRGRP